MNFVLCNSCNKKVFIDNDKFDSSKHYYMCSICENNTFFFNKTEIKKHFLLNNKDLSSITFFYKNDKNHLYKYSDILSVLDKKYKTVDNFNDIKNKKIEKKYNFDRKLKEEKQFRYLKIKKLFEENKLNVKNYGDCYTYINNGYPSIDDIIKNELYLKKKQVNILLELNKNNLSNNKKLQRGDIFIEL